MTINSIYARFLYITSKTNKMKTLLISLVLLFGTVSVASAGWVSGHYRSNGTWVNGYYRTDPDKYEWNNYSYKPRTFKPYKPQTYQPRYYNNYRGYNW